MYRVYKDRKPKKLEALLLFSVCLLFALWSMFDLGSWTLFGGSAFIMAAWSPVDLFALSFFLFSYYFLYVFFTGKDLPPIQKMAGLLIIAPTLVTTFFGFNLSTYHVPICEASETTGFAVNYVYIVKALFILLIIALGRGEYKKAKDILTKKQIMSATISMFVFLFTFFCATFLANILANYEGLEDAYVYGLYGLFSMPLFLVFFGRLLIKYDPFQLKLISAQFLVWTLATIVVSQFFFIVDPLGLFLNAFVLILISVFGTRLIRSIKAEIAVANQNQTKLIYTLTHQLKGRFGKLKNIFAEILGGDYGKVPDTINTFLNQGAEEVRTGIEYVDTVLKRANTANTSLVFRTEPIDISNLISEIVVLLRHRAEAKKLELKVVIKEGNYFLSIDRVQLTEAFSDIIDNAITFTTEGSVSVTLDTDEHHIIFSVKDTGIGISEDEMIRLFTPGGRSEDSLLYNVNSTGFGLAFTKAVVEAHDGLIWAESEGKGKGSTFFVTLPKENK